MLIERYQSKFIAFNEPDQTTLDWLREAQTESSKFWLQIWHIVARFVLAAFMTQTDVNGYFVFIY